MKEMLLLEKEREEAQAKEALLAVSMQEDKKKLLDDLTKENAKIEAAVKDLQKLKDQEKAELLNNLHGGKILFIINFFRVLTRWQYGYKKLEYHYKIISISGYSINSVSEFSVRSLQVFLGVSVSVFRNIMSL